MKHLKRVWLIIPLLFSISGCGQKVVDNSTISSSNGESPESTVRAQDCYRLTGLGAHAVNNARLNNLKYEARQLAKSGLKFANDGLSEAAESSTSENIDDDNSSSSPLPDSESSHAGDIIRGNLSIALNYSDVQKYTLNELFLLGYHNGTVLRDGNETKNRKYALTPNENDDTTLLYPSTDLNQEELTNFDLTANTTYGFQPIDHNFVGTTETSITYVLTNNTGVLSESKATNIHFNVSIADDLPVTGPATIYSKQFNYTTTYDDVTNYGKYYILDRYTALDKSAKLDVEWEMTEEEYEAQRIAGIEKLKSGDSEFSVSIPFKIKNETNNTLSDTFNIVFSFYDRVAPQLYKNGELQQLETIQGSLKNLNLNLGDLRMVRNYGDDKYNSLLETDLKNAGYTFIDEIDGECDPEVYTRRNNSLEIRVEDKSWNVAYFGDDNTKFSRYHWDEHYLYDDYNNLYYYIGSDSVDLWTDADAKADVNVGTIFEQDKQYFFAGRQNETLTINGKNFLLRDYVYAKNFAFSKDTPTFAEIFERDIHTWAYSACMYGTPDDKANSCFIDKSLSYMKTKIENNREVYDSGLMIDIMFVKTVYTNSDDPTFLYQFNGGGHGSEFAINSVDKIVTNTSYDDYIKLVNEGKA